MIRRFLPFLLLCLCAQNLFAQGEANVLSSDEKALGWRLLFDGQKPIGLRGLQKPDFLRAGWKVDAGELTLTKSIMQTGKVTAGDLVTSEQFIDFEFAFEYKLGVSGNAGILYMARSGLGGKPTGLEFQLIDDTHHPEGLKGGPIRRTGALDGLLPPGPNARMTPGDWNSGRLIVLGNHVEHWLNQEKVLEYDLGSPAFLQAVKSSKLRVGPGFGAKIKTPIVLLDQGEEISFRNLKIRPLIPAPAAPR